jgi:hypothetical protein
VGWGRGGSNGQGGKGRPGRQGVAKSADGGQWYQVLAAAGGGGGSSLKIVARGCKGGQPERVCKCGHEMQSRRGRWLVRSSTSVAFCFTLISGGMLRAGSTRAPGQPASREFQRAAAFCASHSPVLLLFYVLLALLLQRAFVVYPWAFATGGVPLRELRRFSFFAALNLPLPSSKVRLPPRLS